MEIIFINTENSKTTEPNSFKHPFSNKLNLKNPSKNIALANLSIYFTKKNIKSEYNNNRFKIHAATWDNEFNLPGGSYSISDIQNYFEYIIKKYETITDNPSAQVYVNKIKNRIAFNIKTGYKLELLSEETMRLLGSSKEDIDQDKDGEIVQKSEVLAIVLVHCNLVNNTHQQASKVFFTFVPRKQFGQLINTEPQSLTMLEATSAEISFIEIWFANQNNRPMEIEDNVNITVIIGTDHENTISI